MQLLPLYLGGSAGQELLTLIGEAEIYLTPEQQQIPAGIFFNEVAKLAGQPSVATIRDELRDRALQGLALKLRQRARVETSPGNIVSSLLAQGTAWDPALVSDADFAWKHALLPRRSRKIPKQYEARADHKASLEGAVSAVCYARDSGEIFLGFANGQLCCFHPVSGELTHFPRPRTATAAWPAPDDDTQTVGTLRRPGAAKISSLACTSDGHTVLALRQGMLNDNNLTCYVRRGEGEFRQERKMIFSRPMGWLTPELAQDRNLSIVGVWNERKLAFFQCPALIYGGEAAGSASGDAPCALLVRNPVKHSRDDGLDIGVIVFDQGCVSFTAAQTRTDDEWHPKHEIVASLGWTPANSEASNVEHPQVSWLVSPGRDMLALEVLGLAANGNVYWSLLRITQQAIRVENTNVTVRAHGYLAATLFKYGRIGAVSGTHVDWLQSGKAGFTVTASTKIALPDTVACFPGSGDLIVVSNDGTISRVPAPH
jgi:hypothetical protein